jgi:hypothetical protein
MLHSPSLFAHGVISAILLCCGLAGSCASAQEELYMAETEDGRVRFYLSEETARGSFARFCETHTQQRCDVFEKYRIIVTFDPALFRLQFVHQELTATPRSVVSSIVCTYDGPGEQCGSGRSQ